MLRPMSPNEQYRALREEVGSRDEVASMLGLDCRVLAFRETDGPVTDEALLALEAVRNLRLMSASSRRITRLAAD